MTTALKTDIQHPKKFHYLQSLPLLGNLPEFNADRLGILQRMAQAGDVYGLHFGPFPGILFNRPEHVHAIMEDHLLLATLAQRVSFSLLPHQNIEPDPVHHLTLRPVGAVNVSLKKR